MKKGKLFLLISYIQFIASIVNKLFLNFFQLHNSPSLDQKLGKIEIPDENIVKKNATLEMIKKALTEWTSGVAGLHKYLNYKIINYMTL